MQKNLSSALALLFLCFIAFGQVQVDRPIDLNSATPGNARLMGIKQVSAPQDAVSAEVLQKGSLIHATVTGGPNAYTLSFSPTIGTPYSAGMVVIFIANGDNTAAVTLNTIPLKKDVNIALAPSDIKNGQLVTVAYDGTNFQLQSRTADANSGGTVTNVTGTAPIVSSGGNTPAISISAATGSAAGSMSAADKTKLDAITGTNTGNVTLGGIGAAPNANGATLSGQAFNLEPASASFGGVLTNGTQSIAGAKTFTGQGTFKSNAGVVNMEGTDHAYIQWFPTGAAAGRKGYTGWGGAGINDFTIANEISGGDIVIAATGTGKARVAGLGAGIVHSNASGQLSASSVTNAELANSSITVTPSGIGLSVSGSPVSLGGTVTITSNATSANTGSAIVARDASGNFSAGTITATLNGKAGLLNYNDIRTLSPNSFAHNAMAFGFTSYNNNNTGPYADFLQLNSYSDGSGGNDNLITVSRGSIGMRVWQQSWNSATAFTSYKDVAFQQDAWMKLAEVDVSAVNSTSITGLDGNSYRHFKIFFQGSISASADRRFLIRPNGSTSTYNGFTNFNGSSGGGEWETGGLYVGRNTNSMGGDVEFEYTMSTLTGRRRMGHGLMTFIRSDAGTQYDWVSSSYWSDTSTNITSLTIMLNAAGTFTGKIIVMGF